MRWINYWQLYVLGCSPKFLEIKDNCLLDFFVNDFFRSIGQVIFCNNPISGLLILIAILIDEKMMGAACYGATAVLVACLTARLTLKEDSRDASRNGLFGFNSFLIGLAMSLFLKKSSDDWTPDFRLILMVTMLPIVAVYVQVALSSISKYPCFTLPFNIMVLCFLLEAERKDSVFSVNTDLIHPSPIILNVHGVSNMNSTSYSNVFTEGSIRGVSQIFLVDNMVSAAIMLVAVLFYSRISCITILLGSSVGLGFSAIIGASTNSVALGLWGYNSALCTLALAGIFITLDHIRVMLYAVLCGAFSTLISGMLMTVLAPWGLPVLTVPFCIAILIFFISRDRFKGINFLPLSDITTPEEHIKKQGYASATGDVNVSCSSNSDEVALGHDELESLHASL